MSMQLPVYAKWKYKIPHHLFSSLFHEMHACVHNMYACMYFSKVLNYTPHMLYISLEIKLELYLLRLWLNVMEHSTGLIVHIIYACMHGCIWTFNHFLMVLNIIFSNRPIHIQKNRSPETFGFRDAYMHACMHTYDFIRK